MFSKLCENHWWSSKTKPDEKQDAVIAQLRTNQLALTEGIQNLADSNRDVLTLQQELPFPGVAAPPAKSPPKSPKKKDL